MEVDSISTALRLVRVQHWTAIAVLISALVVPVAFVFVLRRVAARRPRWQQVSLWLAGCTSSLVYVAAASVFAVCWGGEIGESGKARLARAYAAPVIDALARYRGATGAYPARLVDLVPTYLTDEALRAPESHPLDYPFEYSRDSATYELLVRYVGPGMNECRHAPDRGWRCGGYF